MRSFLKTADLGVSVEGLFLPVKLRRNAQARKMILRVDSTTGELKLTAPKHVSVRELQKFLDENQNWIAAEKAKVADMPELGPGDVFPLLGHRVVIHHTGVPPRKVSLADGQLTVGGPIDQAPARLVRWLRAEAKRILMDDAGEFAHQLGVSFKRVSIGDMKSRWGSCSSTGTLRFNWRLIMAPVDVRRYVAAHEVCHLLEMNHSPQFWAHVSSLDSRYKINRKWLREHGVDLMRLRFKNHQTDG
ncbi:MAG: M48 family metallopeptidase [Kordiimonadaceae bacterium]|nr:M48 family metallopeptidase [Kordiimonadaceae bacterium]MBO6568040.1 M48 family metallopeptidase [Kordiimonadaceae bacterium]MBO6964230.1 M48 family metallopeptidase [Kordiimonadaceae bacterium]